MKKVLTRKVHQKSADLCQARVKAETWLPELIEATLDMNEVQMHPVELSLPAPLQLRWWRR